MSRKLSLLISTTAIAFAVMACNAPGGSAAPNEDITPQAEITAQPTTAAELGDQLPDATGEPVDDVQDDPGRVTGFSFAEITFSPDNTMTDVSGEAVAGETVAPDGPWWVMPAHTRVSFNNYPLTGTMHQPYIVVIPVANFAGYPEAVSTVVDNLRNILADRPDLTGMGGMLAPLPQLPPFNAAQVIAAQKQYLDFTNGSGIRYITQYDQAPIPINNHELIYTYQGLTSDGLYYVAAVFPISHPGLPSGTEFTDADFEALSANYEQIMADVTATLNSSDPALFAPNLLNLDAMIQSISIAPAQ